jgi:hypothetical protein
MKEGFDRIRPAANDNEVDKNKNEAAITSEVVERLAEFNSLAEQLEEMLQKEPVNKALFHAVKSKAFNIVMKFTIPNHQDVRYIAIERFNGILRAQKEKGIE